MSKDTPAGHDSDFNEQNHGAGKSPKRSGSRRKRMQAESLEERILLSGTWADVDTGDLVDGATDGADAFDGSAADDFASGLGGNDDLFGNAGDDTLSGDAGDDTLQGGAGDDTLTGGAGDDLLEGGEGNDLLNADGGSDTVDGGDGDDTIVVSNAVSGDVITVDGGEGTDRIDLSAYDADRVTFGDGSMQVETDDGGSFTIEYSNIEAISFADADAMVLTGDADGSTADGPGILIAGDTATAIEYDGAGSAQWSFDAESGSLTVTGVSGADAGSSLTIDSLSDTAMPIESVTIDSDLGSITSDTDIGTLTIDHEAVVGSVSVEGGSIGTVSFEGGIADAGPVEFNADIGTLQAQEFGADITVNGDVGSVSIADNINNESTLVITGDVDTITLGGAIDVGSTVTIGGDVGSMETGNDIRGAVTISGDAGSISVGDDLTDGSSLTVGGDLDTLSVNDDIKDHSVVDIGGSVGTVDVRGSIMGGSSIAIGGDLDTLTTTYINADISIAGDAGTITVSGNGIDSDLKGTLQIGGDLTTLEVHDDVEATVSIGGNAGSLIAGDDFKGAGDINIAGDLGSITAGDGISKNIIVGGDAGTLSADGTLSGNVQIGANLGTLTASHATGDLAITGDAGSITINGTGSDADFRGDISVGGHLTTMSIADDFEGSLSVGGNAGTLSAGDDFKGSGSITIGGNLSSITAGDLISVDLTTGGDIGTISASTMTGDLTVGDDLSRFDVERMDGTISGSGDHNRLNTSASDETIMTGSGNDYVVANGGNDNISLGDGNDWARVGDSAASNDTIDGGSGTDGVDYYDAGAAVDIDLEAGTVTGDTENDTLISIENATGSNFDDAISGTDGNNSLSGRSGDDTIIAGAGNDSLNGGSGSDTLDAGDGNDWIYAGESVAGDDVAADTISGGDGTDTLSYIHAGSGVDIDMNAGTATGASENDTFTGIENARGSNHDDTITGDAGSNTIDGERGDDTIDAGAGDDQIYGGLGDDTIDGGEGTDWVRYNDIRGGVNVDLGAGTATGAGGNDTLTNIENIFGSGSDDTLAGDDGANTIQGYNGNDTIRGGLGDDTLDGDGGTDTVSYSDIEGGGVDVNLTTGTASGAGGNDTLRDFENAEGSNQADTLTGNNADNVLSGLDGDDTINAGGGNDTVYGGAGDDTIDGGSGNDRILYGEGADTVFGGDGNDIIDDVSGSTINTTGVTLDGGAGNDQIWGGDGADQIIGGTGNDSLRGHGGDDTILGGEGNDTLRGDAGDDILDGGAGNDTLFAGSGNDVLTGGDGTDTANYSDSSHAITVDLNGGTVASDAGNDTFTGIESFVGSSGDDTFQFNDPAAGDHFTINGNGGSNTLDLSAFSRTDIVMTAGGDSITVTLPSGETASVDFSNIDRVVLSDADFDPRIGAPAAGEQVGTLNEDGSFTTGELVDADALESGRAFVTDIQPPAHGTVTVNDDGTFTYTPDPDFSGIDSFSYTLDDVTGNTTATVTLAIDPEADAPVLVIADVAGFEDTAIAIDVSAALTDTDGSETVRVIVSNVPEGATLSAGTDNGDGSWTIAGDELDGLSITPPANFSGDFDLQVVAISTDATPMEATFSAETISSYGGANQDLTGGATVTDDGSGIEMTGNTWKEIPFPVTISEDTVLEFQFRATGSAEINGIGFDNDDGLSEGRTFQIRGSQEWGLDPGSSYTADGEWQTFRIPVGEFFTGDFEKLTFAHDNDANTAGTSAFRNVRVLQLADEAATEPQTVSVSVAAVLDGIELDTTDVSGMEDAEIPLQIDADFLDNDGSESHVITISGVPEGATLNAGTNNGDGTWTIPAADVDSLAVTPPADSDADFTLTISATATETSTGETSTVVRQIGVGVEAVADAAVFEVGDGTDEITFRVSSDEWRGEPLMRIRVDGQQVGSLIPITADHSADEWQEITISGDFGPLGPGRVEVEFVNDAWGGTSDTDRNLYVDRIEVNGKGFEAEDAEYDRRHGSDIAGQEGMYWSGSLVFDTASAPDAVLAGVEDQPVALPISASLADADGSESLRVRISGIPEGASLNAGTDLGDGVWSLTPAELDGLELTPPEHFHGAVSLTIEAETTEARGDTNTQTAQIEINFASAADAARIEAVDTAVDFGEPIPLQISVNAEGGDAIESVVVEGIPEGATLEGVPGPDAIEDLGEGRFRVPAGMLDGLTLIPAEGFSGDLDLVITVNSTDGMGSEAASSASISVTVRPEPEPEPELEPEPEPELATEPEPELATEPELVTEPELEAEPEIATEPTDPADQDDTAVISASAESNDRAAEAQDDDAAAQDNRPPEIQWDADIELGVIDTVAEIDQTLEDIDQAVDEFDLPARDLDTASAAEGFIPINEVQPLVVDAGDDEAPLPPPSDPIFEFSEETGRTNAARDGSASASAESIATDQQTSEIDEAPTKTVRRQIADSFALLFGLTRSIGGKQTDNKADGRGPGRGGRA